MLSTLIVHLANRSCLLERIAGLVRRRNIEIRSVSIGPTDMPGTLRMTLVVEADENKAVLLAANLRKLADVARVENLALSSSLARELAIVKIATTREERSEILAIATVFRARVVDICRGSITIEATGSEAKIDALIEAVAVYGIIEVARTGRIAMLRGLNKQPRAPDEHGLVANEEEDDQEKNEEENNDSEAVPIIANQRRR